MLGFSIMFVTFFVCVVSNNFNEELVKLHQKLFKSVELLNFL